MTFSETVTGFTASDISFAGSTVGGTLSAVVTGTGPTYNVAVSGMTGTGNVVVSVPAGAATDAAGNASLASTSTDNTVAYDAAAPSVTINQAAGQADPTSASPINFTVTFSETVTGFTASDISFAGSTVGGTLTAVVTGTGPTYNVAVSGMTGAGTVVVSVPAGAATDAAGNASLASTSTDNTVAFSTVDTTAPTVQSINRVGTTPTNAASVSWTVLFSESVTGVDASDFTLVTTGAVTGATITTVSGSGSQYTVTANTGTGNGTLGLNLVDNDTILDTSANPLGGTGSGNGNFTGQSYTIDKTAPTVTINQAAGQADPTSASPINFTVTFSETVTGFTASDISFAGSTVGGTLTAVVTGTGPTYNVAVSGMTGTGNVVVSVPAGAATDAAGNASLASTSTDNTVAYNVSSASYFRNEILATGFNLPTTMVFLPNGDMLVGGDLAERFDVLLPPYTQIEPTPFLQITNIGHIDSLRRNQGLYTIALDPNFATNHYYLRLLYARVAEPRSSLALHCQCDADRHSRWERAGPLRRSGRQRSRSPRWRDQCSAMMACSTSRLANNSKAAPAQDLSSTQGKILRLNPDSTDRPLQVIPSRTTPGADPRIWAYGLRNPFRAYYDAPTGRMLIGDVGFTAPWEEINLGVAGANYGWPNAEGPSNNPAYTNPIYSYNHNGPATRPSWQGSCITAPSFRAAIKEAFFFGDYTGHNASSI